MAGYSDEYFTCADGLKLHYRDYNSAPGNPPVVLCLPGLTRNARDFSEVAEHLSDRCRVLCVEMRGRGLSEWDTDPTRYQPVTYVNDVMTLLEQLKIRNVIALGTSLGGIMTILLHAMHGNVLTAAILNDIGPEAEPQGIARIQSYVGKASSVTSWEEAIDQVKTANSAVYPNFTDHQWDAFTRRLYSEKDGVPAPDYDPAIAKNLNTSVEEAAPDLWPVFAAMSSIPLLVIRGEISDILSESTVGVMNQVHSDFVSVTVPGVGHAPLLSEPECLAAIDKLVRRVEDKLIVRG